MKRRRSEASEEDKKREIEQQKQSKKQKLVPYTQDGGREFEGRRPRTLWGPPLRIASSQ